MSGLNKLKKKLHFKKLIDFLYLYKNVLFYHSNNNKKKALHHEMMWHQSKIDTTLSLDNYSVLFLINFARVRKVAKSENCDHLSTNAHRSLTSPTSRSDVSDVGDVSDESPVFSKNPGNHHQMINTWSDSTSREQKLSLLSQLTLAGARGSTLLIGCASLECMQNKILTFNPVCSPKKLQTQNNCDYACIGAIYDNVYIDNRDCLRLAQINTQTENLHLMETLSNPGNVVVEKLLIPTLLMSLYLQMRCK